MIAVEGADTELGRRVLRSLGTDGVVALEVGATEVPSGTSTLVVLSSGDYDTLATRRRSATTGAGAVLASAEQVGVQRIVLLSSAMVYGAWPNNPMPLTEEAPLRPGQEFAFARQLAATEFLVESWRRAEEHRRVCVLRPVPAMAARGTSSVARALAAGYGLRAGEEDAPCQFVHLDDVASAVLLAVERDLDGVFNVAPDGSIDASSVRALAGDPPRLRLPGRAADLVSGLRWRFQRGPIPPGLWPYTRWPWLVANDRLRAEGWRPTATNEQVYVEGTETRWWTMLTPKRKQELSLGVAAGVLLALVTTFTVLGWRALRGRRAARRG